MLDIVVPLPLSGRSASCGGTPALVEHVAEHVVGDIGHADLHFCPANPNRADEEFHLALLPGEDMFDGGAYFRAVAIGRRHCFRHGLALRLPLMDVRLQAIVLQPFLIGLRAIGTVGPDRRCRIVLGDDVPELGAVMGARTRHCPSPDEAVCPGDTRMVFVAEHRNGNVMLLRRGGCRRFRRLSGLGTLHRPTRVAILLRELGGFVLPLVGDLASLDRRFFVLAVVLPGRLNDRRIDDLSALGEIPGSR